MSTGNVIVQTRNQIRSWSWLKKSLLGIAAAGFAASSFLFLTPPGLSIREKLAETVITTQHRDWAWIFVGAETRDAMVRQMQDNMELMGEGHIDTSKIKVGKRPVGDLIKVTDISGPLWKGKKMYVYDPNSIRVVVPHEQGHGEKISDMVKRTGAVAGVNGGGFDDPDGLGNGFAPIGFIMSETKVLFTGYEGSIPQHVVGFTKEGKLIVGKYTINELNALHVSEAVSFYPRVIADGKPLITKGDGGWGRGPRTAVGQKADGTVIFIVVDGRQTHSVGATLREIQDEFLKDDVVNAGFLDGGASSELVVGSNVLTKPSSKYGERRLPSAFLVFDNPNSYKADAIWSGLTKIDPGGAYDHPEYQAELRAKGAASSSSPSPSSTSGSRTPAATAKPKATSEPRSTSGGSGTAPSPSAGSAKQEPSGSPAAVTAKPTPRVSASPKSVAPSSGGDSGGAATAPADVVVKP